MKTSVRYILVRTVRNMRRNLFLHVTTVGVITLSGLIFSAFSLIAFNVASFLKIWEDRIEVIAYLTRNVRASDIETLLDPLRKLAGVESVKYVSSSEAMAFMEAKLGNQKNLLDGIQPLVLPSSVEIQLKKEYRNATGIGEVVGQLKQFPQIEEIQYGQEWVNLFSALVHVLALTQWVLGGFLLLAMAFIISNTLQLTIASRREEIEIMQWVGASPWVIRIPFYLEGMIQGLLGTGLALFSLFFLQKGVLLSLPQSIQDWLTHVPILFLPPEILIGILAGGMSLGFLGSLMASTRFFRYGG